MSWHCSWWDKKTERYQRRYSERQQASSETRYEEKITFPAGKGACPSGTGLRSEMPTAWGHMISHKVRRRRYHTQLPGSRDRRNTGSTSSQKHIILRGEAFLLQDVPSTRGIRAIRQVYRRPSTAGTEMQPPSQCQRLVLVWHKMTTLMSSFSDRSGPTLLTIPSSHLFSTCQANQASSYARQYIRVSYQRAVLSHPSLKSWLLKQQFI